MKRKLARVSEEGVARGQGAARRLHARRCSSPRMLPGSVLVGGLRRSPRRAGQSARRQLAAAFLLVPSWARKPQGVWFGTTPLCLQLFPRAGWVRAIDLGSTLGRGEKGSKKSPPCHQRRGIAADRRRSSEAARPHRLRGKGPAATGDPLREIQAVALTSSH